MVTNLQGAAAGNKNTFLSELTDEQISDALYFVGQEDYKSAKYIIDGGKIEDILSINAAISSQTTDMEEEYASERGELDTYIDEALDDPDFQKIVEEYREKYGDLTIINQANYGAYEAWSPNDLHCKVADYYRGKGDHKKANAIFHYNETIPEIDDYWKKKIKETSYLIEEEMIKRELEDIDDPKFEETAGQYKVFDMYSLDSYNELEAEGEFEVGSLTMMGLAQDPYVSSDEIQDMSLMTKEQRQYYAYYMITDKAKAKEYLSVIRREMNARRAERMREDIAETAEKPGGKLLLAIQSIPLKFVSGLSWIGTGIDSLGEYKPADPNAWYMIPAQMAAETRAGATSDMGGVEQFFANAALSIADFAVAYFATGGAGAMASALGKATLTTLMATEAAGLATYDVLQRGGSTGEAFWTGTLVGGVEAATELIGIGALDDAFKAIKKGADGTRILQNIVRQGVAEGGEEIISEIGGNIADNIINGRNSNYYRYIDELMMGGKSREEARSLAQLKFFGSDLVLAFAGGALSGFAMGGGVSAYGHYSTQSKMDNMVATTLGWDESVYKSLPKDSKTYLRKQFKTFLNKVSGDVVSEKLKLTDGKSMSPEKVVKLTEINGELAKSLKAEISNAEAHLSELNAINKPTQKQKTQIEQLTEQIKSDQIYLEVVNESIDEMKVENKRSTAMYDANTPVLYAQDGRSLTSTNSIRSSNKRINPAKQKAGQPKQAQDTALEKGDKIQQVQRMTEAGQPKQTKDKAISERQSVQKLKPAAFKVGDAKTNVKGIASVQNGKVTVELENGDLAIADDMEFDSETQGQLLDKARHFDTSAAKTFMAVYEANIPINDYFLGFTRIHGAARAGTAFEQAVKLTEYTAALPSHIQKAAYNAGAQAGAIADDASMKNATSVKVKTEQLRFNKWLKEHKTEVIAKKQKISERFEEAEANGDIALMNKLRDIYKRLNNNYHKIIRNMTAKFGKAVGGMVEYGGEKVDAEKTSNKKLDPLDNPKISLEIEIDEKAIYGYSPKLDSSLSKLGVDWTNQEEVEYARNERIKYHEKLAAKKNKLDGEVNKLLNKGMDMEHIAHLMVRQRNQERINSYLKSNNLIGLKALKQRNIDKYGRADGPTPEQLFSKYGTWEEVIYATVKCNLAMDVLTGLYNNIKGEN